MAISAFDLFKIGIGPSSSHTVGPMRAAREFVAGLRADGLLDDTHGVRAELFGSLGATGKGHGSDVAVLLGLEGEDPETVDTQSVADRVRRIRDAATLRLAGVRPVRFVEKHHLVLYRRKTLPYHPNGMRFTAFDASGKTVKARIFYSVGGGFVQVPCIERNAMASVKAINAARMALRGDGAHFVPLDNAIRTMRDTGRDMKDKYKETARGGLAVNVIEVPVSFIGC